MRPTLVSWHLGGHELALPSYGLLVAVGFVVGIVLFWREGRRDGLDGERLLDLSFWSIVAGLVGSRLAFVGLNAGDFIEGCLAGGASIFPSRLSACTSPLRFWEGGFVFYGGVLASAGVVVLFCRREGWSFWRIGDLAAPTLAIGHALGRLGCYLAGCCFGKDCAAPWGQSFPPGSVAYEELQAVGVLAPHAPGTPPLHPTQLYEATGELVIFALLLILRRSWQARDRAAEGAAPRGRPSPPRPGGLLLTYVGAYALLRFVVELFRGDVSRRYLFEAHWPALAHALKLPAAEPLFLSVSQFTSLLMLAGVAAALWRRRTGHS